MIWTWVFIFYLFLVWLVAVWAAGPYGVSERNDDSLLKFAVFESTVGGVLLFPLGLSSLPLGFFFLSILGLFVSVIVLMFFGAAVGEEWLHRHTHRQFLRDWQEEGRADLLYGFFTDYKERGYKLFLVDENKIGVEQNPDLGAKELYRWWTQKQKEGNKLQWRNSKGEVVAGEHWVA